MKLQVIIVLILFLCGCASTQQTGGQADQSKYTTSKLSRQERIIEDACIKSRNIFYWTEEQLHKEFGIPKTQSVSPKDPSGQTQLCTYEAAGRLMKVSVKNGKVVDVNYTASTYGLGSGGGRRERERNYALSLKKIEAAALEEKKREEAAALEEKMREDDLFLEEEGIVIEKKERGIVAYMNGTEDGEGNIYPAEETVDSSSVSVLREDVIVYDAIDEDEFLEPVF